MQPYSKRFSALSDKSAWAFLIVGIVFAALSASFDFGLAIGEGLVLLCLFLFLRRSRQAQETDAQVYLDGLNQQVDLSARQALIHCPLPIVIFQTGSERILWANEPFSHLTGDKEHLFETKLSTLVPDFQSQWLLDGDPISPEPIVVGEQRFLVYGHLASLAGE